MARARGGRVFGGRARRRAPSGGAQCCRLNAAKKLLEEFNEAKRRPGRLQAERVRFTDVAARYLVARKTTCDGTPRPKSSLAKERSCLNIYLIRLSATPG